MKHEAKCKICGKVLVLTIADDYPTGRDPLRLVPMATCNPCFDLRERRVKIETQIKKFCHILELLAEKDQITETEGKAIRTATEAVVMLAAKYSVWCGDALRRPATVQGVKFLADALARHPARWWYHLADFEASVNRSEKESPEHQTAEAEYHRECRDDR